MKKHTRIYLTAMGYDPCDWIQCEIPGCGQAACDIHHIKSRGMGGSKEKDNPENLMGLCRPHHEQYGDKKQHIDFLLKTHKRLLYERNSISN